MKTLKYPRKNFDENNIDLKKVKDLISEHESDVTSLQQLHDYYMGEHAIKDNERLENQPNFKPVCNHVKDICDTATGYFMGNPVTYNNTAKGDIDKLLTAFDIADVDELDSDNALNMSIYGVAYELVYALEGENTLQCVELDVRNTFIVYDDSIECKPLFAVYYNKERDNATSKTDYDIYVMTNNLIIHFVKDVPNITPHYFGEIPVIEYPNNKYKIGDAEQQLGLIDCYNSLMANRVNDKEQFINSLLMIYGARLADTTEDSIEAMKLLRKAGLLELPLEAKAEYIAHTLDESSVETLKEAIKNDIYTFSHVPNLTDENFAGNSSGVAMEYKLLGLEMITKTKERYYTKGLKKRIRLFATYMNLTNIMVDVNSIVPQFSRGLPKNILEISQIIANLEGKVTLRQLISLLPFVEDPDAEIKALEEEKQANMERMIDANMNTGFKNTPPDEVDNTGGDDEDDDNEK